MEEIQYERHDDEGYIGAARAGGPTHHRGLDLHETAGDGLGDGEENGAFVGVGLMERANPPPDELARAADPVMIIERALDDIGLLDLRVLVHGHQVVDGNGENRRPRFLLEERSAPGRKRID